jgi:hypothetical protein
MEIVQRYSKGVSEILLYVTQKRTIHFNQVQAENRYIRVKAFGNCDCCFAKQLVMPFINRHYAARDSDNQNIRIFSADDIFEIAIVEQNLFPEWSFRELWQDVKSEQSAVSLCSNLGYFVTLFLKLLQYIFA